MERGFTHCTYYANASEKCLMTYLVVSGVTDTSGQTETLSFGNIAEQCRMAAVDVMVIGGG